MNFVTLGILEYKKKEKKTLHTLSPPRGFQPLRGLLALWCWSDQRCWSHQKDAGVGLNPSQRRKKRSQVRSIIHQVPMLEAPANVTNQRRRTERERCGDWFRELPPLIASPRLRPQEKDGGCGGAEGEWCQMNERGGRKGRASPSGATRPQRAKTSSSLFRRRSLPPFAAYIGEKNKE